MPDLHDIYKTMNSLKFRMELAAERTERIGRVVAHEQNSATAMLPEPVTRGERRAHSARVRYWHEQVRRYGWADGLAS